MILKFIRVDFTVQEVKIVAEIKMICTFRWLFVCVCVAPAAGGGGPRGVSHCALYSQVP